MRTWKRTYLLPGLLLRRTRIEFVSINNKALPAYSIPKGSIVLYLGIKPVGKTKLIAKFLCGEKVYEYTSFNTTFGGDSIEQQIEAWIKSNFAPLTNE